MSFDWIIIPRIDDAKQYWFGFRYWDGIDKPEYTKMFKIEKIERNLDEGRFRNYHYYYTAPDGINFTYINISNAEEIINWIGENIKQMWSCDPNWMYDDCYYMGHFWFEDEADAMAFKLRWI